MRHSLHLGDLEVELGGAEDSDRLVLRGRIDDRTRLDELLDRLGDRVSIDLELVSFVSSAGVREWLKLIRGLEQRGIAVELARISEPMVRQMNMIVEAVGSASIVSLFAPYQCQSCGYEGSMCLSVARHGDLLRRMEAPAMPCPECRSGMEMVEIPERYFLLLEGQ